MARVVWVSRGAAPLPAQRRLLRELLGSYTLVLVRPPRRFTEAGIDALVREVAQLRPDVVVVFAPRSVYPRVVRAMLGAGLEVWMASLVTLHEEDTVEGCEEFDPERDAVIRRDGRFYHVRVGEFFKVVDVLEVGGRLRLELSPITRADVLV